MAIAKESINEVRERADIVAEIGARVELKKAGGNYVGLCPFHGEKSPSFSVSAPKQFFHCFGCGKSGDVIQFLMEHDGMTFHEAVKDLGERLGVKVQEDQDEHSIRKAQEQRKLTHSLEDLCEVAAKFYQEGLARSPAATNYVKKRGLSPEVMLTYGVGYAANSRKGLASVFPNYSNSSALAEAGLVFDDPDGNRERFDRFRDRLIFPIRDVRGRCIGFGGRIINDDAPGAPKYLNSPESPIFLKGKILYGLHEARVGITREKIAFVTEGYMDVVSMAEHTITNAVAAMGTALTDDHARLLLRFTDRVCFIFDGDSAGQKAAWKSMKVVLPLLEPKHSFSFLTLPDAQDPDEYLRAHGKDKFLALAKAAPTLSQYLVASLLAQYGLEGALPTAEAKTQFCVAAEDLCNLIPESNPLKGMLLQEIDALVGRQPRSVDVPKSAAQRLRERTTPAAAAGNSNQQADAPKRPWIPKDEWMKQGFSGGFKGGASAGYGYRPAPVTPAIDTKTLWQRLCDAIVIAPETAQALASTLLPLLDTESEDEQTLILLLQTCDSIPSRPERYAPDQLQSAKDLLDGAQKVIVKRRLTEVGQELKRMKDDGEMSEDEYVQQMMKLG